MVGHILWLAGISAAMASTEVPTWVLVVAAVSFVVGGGRRAGGMAAVETPVPHGGDLGGVPVALPVSPPVLLSLTVLGVTYL